MIVTASPSTPPTTVAVTIARGIALPFESRTQPKKGTPVSLLAPQLSDSSLKKSPPLANAGSEIKALTANPKAATLPIPIHDFIFISASSDRKQGLHASRIAHTNPARDYIGIHGQVPTGNAQEAMTSCAVRSPDHSAPSIQPFHGDRCSPAKCTRGSGFARSPAQAVIWPGLNTENAPPALGSLPQICTIVFTSCW